MLKNIKDIIIFLLLSIICGAGFYIYHEKRQNYSQKISSEREDTFRTLTVHEEEVTLEESYIGYVIPLHSVSVVPMISGYIEQVLVQGGQTVQAGETLFILRQDEYKASLASSEAKVLQSQAAYENAKIYYERMQKAGGKAISQTDLDNAKTAYLSAQADVASAQAAQEMAAINLGYTIITASIPGLVGDVQVTPGDYVSPSGEALIKLIQYTPIRVVFSIPDKVYLEQKTKNPHHPFKDWILKLRLADGSIFKELGSVQFFNNEVTPQTSSVNVYADFNNPEKLLLSGAYVTVLLEKKIEKAILIPQRLVHLEPTGHFVYTLQEDQPHQTPVIIGPAVGSNFLIEQGLKPGDVVINQTKIELSKQPSSDLKKKDDL